MNYDPKPVTEDTPVGTKVMYATPGVDLRGSTITPVNHGQVTVMWEAEKKWSWKEDIEDLVIAFDQTEIRPLPKWEWT